MLGLQLGLLTLVVSAPAVQTATIGDDVRAREAEMFGASDDDVRLREAEMFGPSSGDDVQTREAEMFGPAASEPAAPAATSTASAPARRRSPRVVLPSDSREPAGPGVLQRLTDRIDELDQTLAIGGTIWLQAQASFAEDQAVEDAALSSPNLVDVFMDGRPNDRVRGFIQGRLTYDPTTSDGGAALAGGLGGTNADTQVQLDQLWLRFDLYRTVFVTAGKQRIRWGSGRLWNPTDFLNQQRLNPIALFDIRLGVPLVKFHVPVESLGWNFYAVANIDEADSIRRIGGALRAEFLLGDTELSLSAALRDGDAQRVGVDFTAPVWDFDVRVELALLHDVRIPRLPPFNDDALSIRDDPERATTPSNEILILYVPEAESQRDRWIPQLVVGAEITIRYSDEDNLILGAEYFYNDAGYTDEAVYQRLILAGQFNPLDVGRHYLGVFASLIGPGDWDRTSFFLSGLANLNDLSAVARIDVSVQLLTFLSFRVFANAFIGSGAFSPEFALDPALLPIVLEDPQDNLALLSERIPFSPQLQGDPTALLATDDGDGGTVNLPRVQLGVALVVRL